jgi:hypothetical protein
LPALHTLHYTSLKNKSAISPPEKELPQTSTAAYSMQNFIASKPSLFPNTYRLERKSGL